MIRNNSSSKSAFLFFVVALVVAGCGGSSSNDQPGSLPAATITISGVVADGLWDFGVDSPELFERFQSEVFPS